VTIKLHTLTTVGHIVLHKFMLNISVNSQFHLEENKAIQIIRTTFWDKLYSS